MTQRPLLDDLHWSARQSGLFDCPAAAPATPAQQPRRAVNREEYAEGYRAGLAGRKLKDPAHLDFIQGHEHGSADKRYNQRASDHAKVFKGWGTLPGQTDFTSE